MKAETPFDKGAGAGAAASAATASNPQDKSALSAMKLKGLPFTVNTEDIVNFFDGFNLINDSIKIGKMGDGKLTGEAAVLFSSAEDCANAHAEKNNKYIGNRWVKLIMVQTHEHTNFEENQSEKFDNRGGSYYGGGRGGYSAAGSGYGGGRGRGNYRGRGGGDSGSYGGQTVRLSDHVTADNRYRCLKMRGLPFSVTIRDIRDFFGDFRVSDRDIIIDMNNGRQTGYGLVFFENEDEAQRAKDDLHRKYLGNSNRYVDLNFPDLK